MSHIYKLRILFLIIVAFLVTGQSSATGDSLRTRFVETKYFRIEFFPASTDEAQKLGARMDELAEKILADMGLSPKDRFIVRLADSDREYRQLQPPKGRPPSWSNAVAYPAKGIMVVRTPRLNRVGGRSDFQWTQTFRHECTHLFLGATLKGRDIPAWLHEGLSQYEARQGNLSMATELAKGVWQDRLFSLAELSSDFPDTIKDAHLAYIQSFYFISYLRNEYGVSSLHRLIYGIGQGEHWGTALRHATGKSILELEAEWISHLKWRFNWVPLLTSTSVLWFLASVLFVVGYIRKRSYAKKKLRVWEIEDAIEDAIEEKKDVDLLH